MRDDERQGVFMFRADMNEMNVEPVDRRHELRQGVQFGLALAPVVICCPIVHDVLDQCELYALGFIIDCLPVRPARRGDAAAQINQCVFRNVDVEGPNYVCPGGLAKSNGEATGSAGRCRRDQ